MKWIPKRNRKYCYLFRKCNKVKVKSLWGKMFWKHKLFVLCTCHLWSYEGIFLFLNRGKLKGNLIGLIAENPFVKCTKRKSPAWGGATHSGFPVSCCCCCCCVLNVKFLCESNVELSHHFWMRTHKFVRLGISESHTWLCQCHGIYIKVHSKWRFNTEMLKCEAQQPLILYWDSVQTSLKEVV